MKMFAISLLFTAVGCGSTIGGTAVPNNLECQEDEVIGFVGVDTLGCVHIDTFKEGG